MLLNDEEGSMRSIGLKALVHCRLERELYVSIEEFLDIQGFKQRIQLGLSCQNYYVNLCLK